MWVAKDVIQAGVKAAAEVPFKPKYPFQSHHQGEATLPQPVNQTQ